MPLLKISKVELGEDSRAEMQYLALTLKRL
jgi:hypothetical protein